MLFDVNGNIADEGDNFSSKVLCKRGVLEITFMMDKSLSGCIFERCFANLSILATELIF